MTTVQLKSLNTIIVRKRKAADNEHLEFRNSLTNPLFTPIIMETLKELRIYHQPQIILDHQDVKLNDFYPMKDDEEEEDDVSTTEEVNVALMDETCLNESTPFIDLIIKLYDALSQCLIENPNAFLSQELKLYLRILAKHLIVDHLVRFHHFSTRLLIVELLISKYMSSPKNNQSKKILYQKILFDRQHAPLTNLEKLRFHWLRSIHFGLTNSSIGYKEELQSCENLLNIIGESITIPSLEQDNVISKEAIAQKLIEQDHASILSNLRSHMNNNNYMESLKIICPLLHEQQFSNSTLKELNSSLQTIIQHLELKSLHGMDPLFLKNIFSITVNSYIHCRDSQETYRYLNIMYACLQSNSIDDYIEGSQHQRLLEWLLYNFKDLEESNDYPKKSKESFTILYILLLYKIGHFVDKSSQFRYLASARIHLEKHFGFRDRKWLYKVFIQQHYPLYLDLVHSPNTCYIGSINGNEFRVTSDRILLELAQLYFFTFGVRLLNNEYDVVRQYYDSTQMEYKVSKLCHYTNMCFIAFDLVEVRADRLLKQYENREVNHVAVRDIYIILKHIYKGLKHYENYSFIQERMNKVILVGDGELSLTEFLEQSNIIEEKKKTMIARAAHLYSRYFSIIYSSHFKSDMLYEQHYIYDLIEVSRLGCAIFPENKETWRKLSHTNRRLLKILIDQGVTHAEKKSVLGESQRERLCISFPEKSFITLEDDINVLIKRCTSYLNNVLQLDENDADTRFNRGKLIYQDFKIKHKAWSRIKDDSGKSSLMEQMKESLNHALSIFRNAIEYEKDNYRYYLYLARVLEYQYILFKSSDPFEYMELYKQCYAMCRLETKPHLQDEKKRQALSNVIYTWQSALLKLTLYHMDHKNLEPFLYDMIELDAFSIIRGGFIERGPESYLSISPERFLSQGDFKRDIPLYQHMSTIVQGFIESLSLSTMNYKALYKLMLCILTPVWHDWPQVLSMMFTIFKPKVNRGRVNTFELRFTSEHQFNDDEDHDTRLTWESRFCHLYMQLFLYYGAGKQWKKNALPVSLKCFVTGIRDEFLSHNPFMKDIYLNSLIIYYYSVIAPYVDVPKKYKGFMNQDDDTTRSSRRFSEWTRDEDLRLALVFIYACDDEIVDKTEELRKSCFDFMKKIPSLPSDHPFRSQQATTSKEECNQFIEMLNQYASRKVSLIRKVS